VLRPVGGRDEHLALRDQEQAIRGRALVEHHGALRVRLLDHPRGELLEHRLGQPLERRHALQQAAALLRGVGEQALWLRGGLQAERRL
jgi:hypothetical protein